ncbi:MAG: hypothetical protein DRN30_02270 [Thermoplasmata archaeon]|nr:MAG: hypothetical protein DRN30_02270 [Thermoplasmata archaeon]
MGLAVGKMDSRLTVYSEFLVSDDVGGKTSMLEAFTYRVTEDGGTLEGSSCIPSSTIEVADIWCNLSYGSGGRYSADGAVEINTTDVTITIRTSEYGINENNKLLVYTRLGASLECMIISLTYTPNGMYTIIKASIV